MPHRTVYYYVKLTAACYKYGMKSFLYTCVLYMKAYTLNMDKEIQLLKQSYVNDSILISFSLHYCVSLVLL